MNDYDRSNLNYIMGLNTEQFDSWALELSDDDIQYAIELIRQARLEVAVQEQNLLDAELEDSNFAEANAVLQKFRL